MKTKLATRLSLGFLVLAAPGAFAAPAAPEKPAADASYSVVDKIPMPGEGGWDYVNVDPAAR
ncbi:MAG TPA: hypothetical protein VIZ69_12140, partial [Thermoanaerobaculia bacterium]